MNRSLLVAGLLLSCVVTARSQEALPPLDAAAAAKVSYRRDVLPIMRRHCTSCHTRNDAQGDLNADTVKLMLRGGGRGPAIKPSKPDESLLVQMLIGTKKPLMPYKQAALPMAKIHTLRQWILAGAKDDSEPTTIVTKIAIPKAYRHAPAISSVAFSPDGKWLAAACRSEVVVVSVDGKEPPKRLETESDLVTCVSFSPDGQILASAGGVPSDYGEVRFYQTAGGTFKLQSARKIGKDTFFRGAFSPDGKSLALGGADGAVYLVPVDEKIALRKADLHSDWVNAVAWSVDGRLLISGSRDKTIKVTTVDTLKLVRSIATSTDTVNAVGATATLAISGGRDRVPATYDLKLSLGDTVLRGSGNDVVPDRPATQYTRRLEGQGGEILDMAMDVKRTKLAVAGASGEVRVYNLPDGRRLATLTNVPPPVFSVAMSSDGTRVATGSQDGKLGIYDATNGKLIRQLVPVPVK